MFYWDESIKNRVEILVFSSISGVKITGLIAYVKRLWDLPSGLASSFRAEVAFQLCFI